MVVLHLHSNAKQRLTHRNKIVRQTFFLLFYFHKLAFRTLIYPGVPAKMYVRILSKIRGKTTKQVRQTCSHSEKFHVHFNLFHHHCWRRCCCWCSLTCRNSQRHSVFAQTINCNHNNELLLMQHIHTHSQRCLVGEHVSKLKTMMKREIKNSMFKCQIEHLHCRLLYKDCVSMITCCYQQNETSAHTYTHADTNTDCT